MNQEITTTFIPKKTFDMQQAGSMTTSFRDGGSGMLSLFAGIICAASLIASIGVYSYKMYLTSSYVGIQKTLMIYQEQFNQNKLEKILLLDKKMAAGQEVYHNHTALSQFFTELGLVTIPDIQYDSFDYSKEDKKISYKMTGQAVSYIAIAQQSRLFGKSPFMKEHVISGLKLGENGRVSFSLDIIPNEDSMKYLYKKPVVKAVQSEDIINDKLKEGLKGDVIQAQGQSDVPIESVNTQIKTETVDVNAKGDTENSNTNTKDSSNEGIGVKKETNTVPLNNKTEKGIGDKVIKK